MQEQPQNVTSFQTGNSEPIGSNLRAFIYLICAGSKMSFFFKVGRGQQARVASAATPLFTDG